MKKGVSILLAVLLTLPLVLAQADDAYHLPLLAVQETTNGTHTGSQADLYLELKPEGSGRVFLDTSPVTKMDTQISTRFAKEIACAHFNLNCDQYDFIYTINAKSNIIGGPSAGAAITALTTIAVLDLDYDESIAITGTINSGGIVGPVGGVKEKLEAAAQDGISKVLIPAGSSHLYQTNNNVSNMSQEPLDLIEYAKQNLSLNAEEVIDINFIVEQLTGEKVLQDSPMIEENSQYAALMQEVQTQLCERTELLEKDLENMPFNQTRMQEYLTQKEIAKNATEQGDYYSAASYCFATNINLKRYYYEVQNSSTKEVHEQFTQLEKEIDELEISISTQKINTISDLQTLIVVKERINDAKQQITRYKDERYTLSKQELFNLLGYAQERFFSAKSWTQFFAMEGKQFDMNKQILKESCEQKITESKEREQYASLFISPLLLTNMQENIERAEQARNEEEYELCLITASQAKAQANAIMGSIGVHNESITQFYESKRDAVERVIAKNSEDNVFPILGYSYYQYADSLYEENQYTGLLYLEYALEMSDLSIYFAQKEDFLSIKQEWRLSKEIKHSLQGFALGILAMLILIWVKPSLFLRKK